MATTALMDLIRNVDPSKSDFTVPNGKYPAEVFEVELTKSKSSDNPMFVLSYKITEGDYKGRKLSFHYITLTEDSAGIAVRQLLAAGAPTQGDIASALADQKAALKLGKAMTGTPVVITVTNETYNDVERSKVKNVAPGTKTASASALDDDDESAPAAKPKKAKKADRPESPF